MSTQSGKERAEKKVKRQKQFIAVGSVVLLAILGFEMTKVLPHGGGQAAAPVQPTATSSSVAGPTAPSSRWRLPDTDRVVVERTSAQLISFGLFGSKDPFVQQLSAAQSPAAAPAATAAPAAVTHPPAKPSKPLDVGLTPVTTTTPGQSAPSSPSVVPAPGTTSAPRATTTPSGAPETAPTTALISTNGACEKVDLTGTFPGGADIFRLVSIARDGKSVELGIVGGSYDSGQPTATLRLGKKLTLVNTADGTRYVIELKSKCDLVVQPSSAAPSSASTTPSPVPPVTTTPTPSTTTPIVPDPLDTTTTPTP
jgi:hypothetical protein